MYTMIKGVCRDLPSHLKNIVGGGDSKFKYDDKFRYSLCYRKFPPMKWAQRADCVLITIEIADCENINVTVDDEKNALLFK